MINLYEKNGLIFWDDKEILLRENLVSFLEVEMRSHLLSKNPAFRFFRCEAPIMTPNDLINANYTDEDIYRLDDVTLRPETTMGTYEYVRHLIRDKHVRLPICAWQLGKSFRKEQDQVTKNMRFKEFYQLEFQIIYSDTTKNDYYAQLPSLMRDVLSNFCGHSSIESSDRLPSYSTETTDIVLSETGLEMCSISRRTDFGEGVKVAEVAIGIDRVIFNSRFLNGI